MCKSGRVVYAPTYVPTVDHYGQILEILPKNSYFSLVPSAVILSNFKNFYSFMNLRNKKF